MHVILIEYTILNYFNSIRFFFLTTDADSKEGNITMSDQQQHSLYQSQVSF